MAKPIKETPYLKGKDAGKFVKKSSSLNVLEPSVKKRIASNYKALQAIFVKQ